jgi:hypothetical protein
MVTFVYDLWGFENDNYFLLLEWKVCDVFRSTLLCCLGLLYPYLSFVLYLPCFGLRVVPAKSSENISVYFFLNFLQFLHKGCCFVIWETFITIECSLQMLIFSMNQSFIYFMLFNIKLYLVCIKIKISAFCC